MGAQFFKIPMSTSIFFNPILVKLKLGVFELPFIGQSVIWSVSQPGISRATAYTGLFRDVDNSNTYTTSMAYVNTVQNLHGLV